jgi:hypothetical protein
MNNNKKEEQKREREKKKEKELKSELQSYVYAGNWCLLGRRNISIVTLLLKYEDQSLIFKGIQNSSDSMTIPHSIHFCSILP